MEVLWLYYAYGYILACITCLCLLPLLLKLQIFLNYFVVSDFMPQMPLIHLIERTEPKTQSAL